MAIGANWAEIWNESIWNASIWAQTVSPNPILLSARISADGGSLITTWSEAVEDGGSGLNGFTATLSGGAATFTYSSGASTAELTHSISRTVDFGETVTNFSYTQPGDGVQAVDDGADVTTFTGESVANGSYANAPASNFNLTRLLTKGSTRTACRQLAS